MVFTELYNMVDIGKSGVHQIDSRNTGEELEEGSVDVVITSPPYADLKDYGHEDQIGHGQEDEEYLEDLTQVFGGVHKALKDTGSMWVVVDTYKRDGDLKMLPFQIADRLKKNFDFKLKDIIVWNKNRTLPWTNKGEMRNVFEYILVFSKSDSMKHEVDRIKNPEDLKQWWKKYPERYNPKGKTPENIWEFEFPVDPDNIWDFDIPTQGAWGGDEVQHACPFSPGMVERIITLTTDEEDVVFDPFAGTGTVIAQAEAMNRRGIGFELNQDYIDNYETRIKPKIMSQWEDKKSERERLEGKREDLQNSIHNLRQLKYPKTIVRRLINDKGWSEEDLSLNTLFSIPVRDEEPEGKHKIMKNLIYIIHQNGLDPEQLEADIQEVIENPPVSKFGIDSEVRIRHRNEVNGELSEHFEENEFYIYSQGKFWDADGKMNYKRWKKASKDVQPSSWKQRYNNGVPPILSPIKITEDHLEDIDENL